MFTFTELMRLQELVENTMFYTRLEEPGDQALRVKLERALEQFVISEDYEVIAKVGDVNIVSRR